MGGNFRVVGDPRGRALGGLQELVLKYVEDRWSLKRGDTAARGVLAGLAKRWHGIGMTRARVGSTVPQGEER